MTNLSNLAALIDTLGAVKAKMAGLEAEAKKLQAALADLEPGKYIGERYSLVISVSERETLDMAAVREHLSRQFIQAHTNVTPVRTHRTAFIGDRAAVLA